MADFYHRGGYATCGGTGAFTVFSNTQLQGCYSPRIPGANSRTAYKPPPNAGYNANGSFVGIVPDSGAGQVGSTTIRSSSRSVRMTLEYPPMAIALIVFKSF